MVGSKESQGENLQKAGGPMRRRDSRRLTQKKKKKKKTKGGHEVGSCIYTQDLDCGLFYRGSGVWPPFHLWSQYCYLRGAEEHVVAELCSGLPHFLERPLYRKADGFLPVGGGHLPWSPKWSNYD